MSESNPIANQTASDSDNMDEQTDAQCLIASLESSVSTSQARVQQFLDKLNMLEKQRAEHMKSAHEAHKKYLELVKGKYYNYYYQNYYQLLLSVTTISLCFLSFVFFAAHPVCFSKLPAAGLEIDVEVQPNEQKKYTN